MVPSLSAVCNKKLPVRPSETARKLKFISRESAVMLLFINAGVQQNDNVGNVMEES